MIKQIGFLLNTIIFFFAAIFLNYNSDSKQYTTTTSAIFSTTNQPQNYNFTLKDLIKPSETPVFTNPLPNSFININKQKLPEKKVISNNYYVSQTFNNCGPASLSMVLSYYGINKSQEELGQIIRPYQNAEGDNDDKSVSLDELAEQAEKYELIAYHRPNGNIQLLKEFTANDIPVITSTWLHLNDDIGHYRIVKGYDDQEKIIIQDDTYEGPNITFFYDDFNRIWSKFDYQYLVIVPKDKQLLAEAIIGKNIDEKYAWQEAIDKNQQELNTDPGNIYSTFNLSVAYYYIGDYKKSVEEYEKVADQLPFRTLWYQIEPIEAYSRLGEYQKVFEITDSILNGGNRAFSELYIIRGNIYKKQGDLTAAKAEYEQAVFYNKNLKI